MAFFDTDHKRAEQIMNEAYFGKTPAVKKIEAIIDQLKRKYDGQYTNMSVHNDPLRYKLNKQIEDTFGFGVVDVQFIQSMMVNAMTYPVGFDLGASITGDDALAIDKSNGYKFKKEYGYSTIIIFYTGLIFRPEISASEVTAILLHEIGHNFTFVALRRVGYVQLAANALLTVATLGHYWVWYGNWGKKVSVDFWNYIDQNIPVAGEVYRMCQMMLSMYTWICANVLDIINMSMVMSAPATVFKFIERYLVSIVAPGKNWLDNAYKFLLLPKEYLVGYSDEQFADSFAAMYGYGPELNTALRKLEESETNLIGRQAISAIPWIRWYYDLIMLPLNFIIQGLDVHPENVARLTNTLRQLETDLKDKRYSPAMRRRLQEDIRNMREQVEKIKELKTSAEKSSDPRLIRNTYDMFLINVLDGDLKHYIYKFASPENVNANFDQIFSKSKKVKF